MLNLYKSLTVPGVERVTIYRDDEIPHKFYMVTDLPALMRTSDGKPMIDFIAYARDTDNVLAEEAADLVEGHMNLTVGLAVPEDKREKIRTELRRILKAEKTSNTKWLGKPVKKTEPELGYIPFYLDGEASVDTLSDTLISVANSTTEPGRFGAAVASFSYALTEEGTSFMVQALQDDVMPVLVRYSNLVFTARIPAITIHVSGNSSDIRREFDSKLPTRRVRLPGGRFITRPIYIPRSRTLGDFRNTFQGLTVTIDDGDFRQANGDTESDAGTAAFEQMAMEIIETQILPSFFEQPELPQEEDDEDEGNNRRFWYLNETESVSKEIDVTFSKRDVVQIPLAASGTVGQSLTSEEKKAAVKTLDLSKPVIPFNQMTVYPNINFETDPVLLLQVIVDYEQFDDVSNERVRKHEEVVFQGSDEPQKILFRQARNTDGTPKTEYNYRAILTYDTTSGLTQAEIPSEGALTSTSENLIISYPMLGHIKSTLSIGQWPASVTSASVRVAHIGADPNDGSAEQFHLSRDKPDAVYLYNMSDPDADSRYSVEATYTLEDQTEIVRDLGTFSGDSVLIPSPFSSVEKTTFVLSGDISTIANAIVTFVYDDTANGFRQSRTLSLGPSDLTKTLETTVIKDGATDFTYSFKIFHTDGSINEKDGQTASLGEIVTLGETARNSIEVIVDASMIDWNVWRMAFVKLTYTPPSGGASNSKTIRFDKDADILFTWHTLTEEVSDATYSREVNFVSLANERQTIGPEISSEPFFILTPTQDGDA